MIATADFHDHGPRLEKRARRRVGRKIGFAVHLLVYTLVNGGLWLFSQTLGHGHGPLGVSLGWGLGLAIHGIVTLLGLAGEGLRDRMVADEVQRLARREESR